jgi:hypothetical protein
MSAEEHFPIGSGPKVAFRSLILDGLIHPERADYGVTEVETRY